MYEETCIREVSCPMLYTTVLALNSSSSDSNFWTFKHFVLLYAKIIIFLHKGDGGDGLKLSVISIVFNACTWGALTSTHFP